MLLIIDSNSIGSLKRRKLVTLLKVDKPKAKGQIATPSANYFKSVLKPKFIMLFL